jgi:flagellar FliL protein
MAEDDATENKAGDDAEAASGGGKKRLIIMIVLALVLVGASVGGTITVLSMMKEEPAPEAGEAGEEEAEAPKKAAIYYPLKPEYIVNIDARGRRRYLRLDLTLLVRDDDMVPTIEMHRASVDNIVNLISGGQIFEEVQTPEGKEFLRLQLLKEMQTLFEKEVGKQGVEQVLFTNFVMQ